MAKMRAASDRGQLPCGLGSERFGRDQEGPSEQGVVLANELGEANARQDLNGEDLLDRPGEANKGDRLPSADVDYPDPALSFLIRGANRNPAEDGRFANLGKTDESKVAKEIETAGEAGELGHGLKIAGLKIDNANPAATGFEDPQAVIVETR